ncbi:translation initiation factor IF-2 [Enterocloster clostridioformis]|uniref:translation initiation factor IF-2 n=1 Tax=Enterocloster clostridioformis TaxID=1531 RepID=UPI00156FBCCD|nr:translation initiation factor IF-2 [Enterocloster clostridioformis]MDB2148726.1 translation initiation factor IF-2 [Enterocloster clostridioformis]NSD56225.1 translation initiation factor IF-2 [Enterocloster clostridioformis]NSJ10163.1 translation initiation factor IF-2 [Enterocloster clostridioformis]NSJ18982.1 translation initiation factor IF-2 [Enterocloster clostridioformis]NSJ30883.1 translation initiation factor IF-2 [Enterocloster clostridioformis]
MRVSELANELGKTSKEILEIIKTKDKSAVLYAASNVTKDQENIVRSFANPKRDAKPAAPEHRTEASKTEASRTEAPRTEAPKTEAPKAEAARNQDGGSKGEPAKKKLTAVFRPQNAQQQIKRPVPPKPQGGKQGHTAPALAAAPQAAQPAPQAALAESAKPQVQAQSADTVSERTAAPQPTQAPQAGVQAGAPGTAQDSRDTARSQGGYQGSRDNNRSQAGYQGSRDNNRGQGGYQGSRDNNRSQGGYQGSRDNNRGQGGYQGGQGGYQGSRDNNRSQGGYQGGQGGYQGSRDNNRPQGGGYQGSRSQGGYQGGQGGGQGGRDNNRPQGGGYQGSRSQGSYQGGQGGGQGGRDNNRPQGGGYQGSRSQGSYQGGQGGYQGSRDNNRPGGGYQGNRDGARPQGGYGNRSQGGYGARSQGGYQGRPGDDKDARDNRGRTDSRRPAGARDGKSSFDTPIQTKPSSNRQNKNAHKNARFDKRDRLEDGKKKVPKTGKGAFIMPQPKKEESKADEVKTITLPDVLTIKELAEKMKLQPSVIVKKLFLKGQVVTLNQEIDYEQAEEIAMEFDVLCEKEVKVDVIAELLKEDEESTEDMVPRSPVVCVMGHVDHGKTSLLDAIRETNVTAREAGGITQHIGASVIKINDRKITFLDTPGHEAFTAMRMRGAQSTDIAILVVAADDGVMPQTVEAINHAKAANVEIIVAINKIDKPSANVDKVKQELAEYELIPEDWGGSTIFVPVSAHTKEGIKDLLEMVLLTADVLELKANPNRKGRGLVIEAELDKGKGPVATVLVQKGTLRVGETIAAGACFGKIRAMMDDRGRRVKEAGPSTPVEILGLNDVPNAGEVFVATENEKEARNFAETFISEGKSKLIEDTKAKLSLDDLFSQIQAGNVKELPIIVKADVQGSVEAVKQSLTKLSNEEVMVKVIHGGVGAINESDVSLASASNAIIIGFNIRPDATAKSIAEREKVDIRLYKVIYQAIEDVEAAMKGMLDPVFEEKIIGHAVIRQTFKASGIGTIAGSYVLDGKFQRNCSCRVKRDGEQIFEGPLASLKRFKDDVKEVAAGYECGLVFEKFNDLQEDDEIEAYIMVEVPR